MAACSHAELDPFPTRRSSDLKAGKIDEARQAVKDALRLGTQDAKLFYHAGMVARAAGDRATAQEYLRRALKLSPFFDPRQSQDRKSTRLNSSHLGISYAVFCL